MSIYTDAKSKITQETESAKKSGSKERVIAEPTADALIEFCKQNEEFAQAVLDGKSFTECVKSVCNSIKGNACSDIEVYRKAVEFYFPGAKVDFQMAIRMSEHEEKNDNIISLDLTSFF